MIPLGLKLYLIKFRIIEKIDAWRNAPHCSYSTFKVLSEEEKVKIIYGGKHVNREIYESVLKEFLKEYGHQKKISKVLVDDYGMGMAPNIILYLKKGGKPLMLSKTFLGFYFFRIYEK
ncbi:hypothetical protein AYB33_17605 [Leptospira santarosai]|uniref:hypothetical protein n=1 Tax=Leptospira santarosai TaxID=28183 RepID=UPI0007784C61|nr:hypothetical protein [Leptospira santarosai]KXZ29003.1 hypothetical protein AYB33_17605 [Leptospira santarosai]